MLNHHRSMPAEITPFSIVSLGLAGLPGGSADITSVFINS